MSAQDTDLSDHDLVDIVISSNPTLGYKEASFNFEGNDFRSLDFTQAKFDEIKDSLKNKDWSSLRASCSFEEFSEKFTSTFLDICIATVQKKSLHRTAT